jgi:glycosyltransferase involved in cell wall biosynthesis
VVEPTPRGAQIVMAFDVLHVVPAIPFGGMQRFVADLAAEQMRQGLDVHVIAVYEDSKLPALLLHRNISFETISGMRPSFAALKNLAQILRLHTSSLVHLHARLLWIEVAGLIAKKSPWIYHVHSYADAGSIKSWVGEILLPRLCDIRIAVSKSVAETLPTWTGNRRRTFIIENGVEIPEQPRQPRGFHSGPYVFGLASRITADKGLSGFVKLASDILALQPDARFVVAGEGNGLPAFENELKAAGISEHVRLLGHVEDMSVFWSTIDVYLFIAPKDTFGLTILEAMMHYVPVAAYQTGSGSDEILVGNRNSLTANYGDSQGLARCAVTLSTSFAQRDEITHNAFATVRDKFSIRHCAKRIAEAYAFLSPHSCKFRDDKTSLCG